MQGAVEGGPCVATLKEASDRGVPLIACMAGSPEMREPFNRWSFPVRAAHLDEFDHLLGIVKTYGYSRVAFVHADSDTGRRHLAHVRRLAGERGIDVAPIPMTAGLTPAALADAIARCTDPWLTSQLDDTLRAILRRERLTRRHAIVKRIEARHPGLLQ